MAELPQETIEKIRQQAYIQGRKDQGEINANLLCEIRTLVYQEGYSKGMADALKPIQKLLDDWFCDRVDDPNWVLSQISICIYEMTKEQKK